MVEIVCGTCGSSSGTHERWCAVGHRIAEIAEKDRRIAELEAALKELQIEFFEHQEDPQRSVTYKWSLTRIGYALAGSPSALDAALAAAKREVLKAVADRAEEMGGVLTDDEIRRMAREVKP